MLYRKNLPWWERALRLVAGAALVGAAAGDGDGAVLRLLLACAGMVLAATAIFGFCPACAMLGRRPVALAQRQDPPE